MVSNLAGTQVYARACAGACVRACVRAGACVCVCVREGEKEGALCLALRSFLSHSASVCTTIHPLQKLC